MASSSRANTRAQSHMWLIGEPQQRFTGKLMLPTNKELLSVLFYHLKQLNKNLRDATTDVASEVLLIWNNAHIPTAETRNVIRKVEQMFESWKKLQKNAKRRTPTQIEKEQDFESTFGKLFDIAHIDAEEIIRNPEDIAFLRDQRNDRIGYMSGIDLQSVRLEESKTKRIEALNKQKSKEHSRQQADKSVRLTSDSEEDNYPDADRDYREPKRRKCSTPTQSTKLTTVVTPELASALDRTKVTDRQATLLIAATAKSLGHDVSSLVVNRTSIARARSDNRCKTDQDLRADFPIESNVLVVHWDGKMMNDISGGNEKVDRLPVIVTGNNQEKLLSVPKLGRSTGEAQATAVVAAIKDWKLEDKVKAMGFDTTNSNTGAINGACHLIETKLGKCLLPLACRHHVMELVIGSAFQASLKMPTKGPDMALFKRFSEQWPYIDQQDYDTVLNDKYVLTILEDNMDKVNDVVDFCINEVKKAQVRDDYREFLELVIIFLGRTPPRGIRFYRPGACHHARWMSKIIYSLKIWVFKRQFKLKKSEETGLRDVSIFVALAYTKAWFTAPNAITAPVNDLHLLKELDNYATINKTISDATTNKFLNHLWYISELNVALAFFSDKVSCETKQKMVTALERDATSSTKKRFVTTRSAIKSLCLEDIVTSNTKQFFTILDISSNFLTSHPTEWESCDEYKDTKTMLGNMKVVNDVAERGVALIQTYNSILTNDEEQKQYLMQVVERNRKQFPDYKKKTVVKMLDMAVSK